MTDLPRIRELLAKADRATSTSTVMIEIWEKQPGYVFPINRVFEVTPAQFAALKTEFPNVWNGE